MVRLIRFFVLSTIFNLFILAQSGFAQTAGQPVGNLKPQFEKPNQSKVVWYDGLWWGVFRENTGDKRWYVYKFDGISWTKDAMLANANGEDQADMHIAEDDNQLYVLMSTNDKVYRLSYTGSGWSLDSGFPTTVSLVTTSSDPASLTRAHNKNIFISNTSGGMMNGIVSRDSAETWTAFTFGIAGTSLTDAITYRQNNTWHTGVFIGEGVGASRYIFKWIPDSLDPTIETNWTEEIVQSTRFPQTEPDDHVSIVRDDKHNLYALCKTGEGPDFALFRRDTLGIWIDYGLFTNGSTRPSLAYDASEEKIYAFGTIQDKIQFTSLDVNNLTDVNADEWQPILENGTDEFNNVSVSYQIHDKSSGIMVAGENDTQGTIWYNFIDLTLIDLNFTTIGNGTVTLDPPGGAYDSASVVRITAVPDPGWQFTSWGDDLSGNANPDSVLLDVDKFITANFAPLGAPVFNLSLTINGAGSVIANPPGGSYVSGTVVELTAVPDSGAIFSQWSGDTTGVGNPIQFKIDGNKTVTANFVSSFKLTTNTVGGGEIAIDSLAADSIYTQGTVLNLTAIPDSAHIFSGWSGDLSGLTNPASLTMDSNKTVTAAFTRQFALNVTPTGFGTVTLDPPGGVYDSATVVTVTATANEGVTFSGWSGDLAGNPNPATITMDSDKNIGTIFLGQFPITTTTDGNGIIDLNPTAVAYDSGSVVIATATPNTNYRFGSWSGDTSSTQNPITVSVDSALTIHADFIREFTVATAIQGSGTIQASPAFPAESDTAVFDSATVITFTATAAPGFLFTGWSGDLSGTNNPAALTVNSDKSVTAIFTEQISLIVNTIGSGTVTVNPEAEIYEPGTVVELQAFPDPGYIFSGWSGDLSGTTNPASIIMDSGKNVTATFTRQFTLTVEPSSFGTIVLDPPGGVYDSATVITATVIPNEGVGFTGWSGDLSGDANPETITIVSDMNIGAIFLVQFSLAVTTDGNGTVTSDPPGANHDSASVVLLTAAANPGFRFNSWSGDISSTQNPIGISVDSSIAVHADFIPQYVVTTSVLGSGTIETNPPLPPNSASGVFDSSTVIQFTATPDPGFSFAGWAGGITGINNPETLTLDGNKTVTAIFVQQFSLDIMEMPGGSVTLTPPGGFYDSGTSVGLLADPDPGFRFSHWTDDLTGTVNPTSVTMNSPKTIAANFIRQFTLTTNITGDGTIILDPPGGVYDTATVVTVTATPATGSLLSGWSGDLSGTDLQQTIVMGSDKSITANFELDLPPQYTIETNVTGMGNILLDPAPISQDENGAVYDSATVITVLAVPSAGSEFLFWDGDLSGTQSPQVIVVDSDMTINAVFNEIGGPSLFSATANSSPAGAGSIDLNPPGGLYDSASVVIFTATANEGYRFKNWSGNLSGTSNPTAIIMNSNKSVTANFLRQFTVSTSAPGGGGIVSQNPSISAYDSASVVTITATPANGYRFAGWSGDISGGQNPIAVTVDSDKIIEATFELDNGIDQFTLTANINGMGNVTLSPDDGIYDEGTVVTLTALADVGYQFNGWSGDLSGLGNPAQITMDSDKNITATFTELPFNIFILSVVTSGNGTVTLSPPGGIYIEGTPVTVTASPGAGHEFSGWSGDLTGTTSPATITMNSDKSIVATFVEQTIEQYSLTLNPTGSGSIIANPPGGVYDEGTVVTLTAVPDANYQFDGWSGDLSGTTSPTTITMDGDKTVNAAFSEIPPQTFTLSSSVAGSGSVLLVPGGGVYTDGSIITVSAIPEEGFEFTGWSGDLSGTANPTIITMNSNKSIIATFAELPPEIFTLTTNVSGQGSISLNPAGGSYDEGTVVTVSAIPDEGYMFDSWSGNLSGTANPTTIVMDGNKSITAAFSEIPPEMFTLTTAVIGSGSITLIPSGGAYEAGTVVVLSATPATGFVFDSWNGDLSGSSNPKTITMDGNKSVTATFADIQPETFTLTTGVTGSGSITLIPSGGVYETGTVVTLAAVAQEGSFFSSWSGHLTGTTNPTTITMDGNKSVIANFQEIPPEMFTLTTGAVGSGSIVLTPPGGVYETGTVVTLNAVPATGFAFSNWFGDITGSTNPTTITMDGNKSVSATFSELPPEMFTLTANVVGSGTVTLSPTGGVYEAGTIVTLTAAPAEGFSFSSWSGDLIGSTSPATITMDGNKSATATFVELPPQTFTLPTSVVGSGSIVLSPAGGVYLSLIHI